MADELQSALSDFQNHVAGRKMAARVAMRYARLPAESEVSAIIHQAIGEKVRFDSGGIASFEGSPNKGEIVRLFNALRKEGWEVKSEGNTEGPGLIANKDDKIHLSIKTIDGYGEAYLSTRPIKLAKSWEWSPESNILVTIAENRRDDVPIVESSGRSDFDSIERRAIGNLLRGGFLDRYEIESGGGVGWGVSLTSKGKRRVDNIQDERDRN